MMLVHFMFSLIAEILEHICRIVQGLTACIQDLLNLKWKIKVKTSWETTA